MNKGVDSSVRAPKALIKCSLTLSGDKETQMLHRGGECWGRQAGGKAGICKHFTGIEIAEQFAGRRNGEEKKN